MYTEAQSGRREEGVDSGSREPENGSIHRALVQLREKSESRLFRNKSVTRNL